LILQLIFLPPFVHIYIKQNQNKKRWRYDNSHAVDDVSLTAPRSIVSVRKIKGTVFFKETDILTVGVNLSMRPLVWELR